MGLVRGLLQSRVEVDACYGQGQRVMPIKAFPGHHLFYNFRTFPKSVSFRFIPKTWSADTSLNETRVATPAPRLTVNVLPSIR